MRSRAFFCACWGRKTRRAPRTAQLGHADTVPLFFFPFAFLLPFAVIVVVVVVAGAMPMVVAMLAVLVVLALLAVLAVLSLLAVLAVLSTLAVLAVLAVLPRLHRLFVLTNFSPLSLFSFPAPVLPIANGLKRPSPNPRDTVTICGSGSGGSVLVARLLGVCVCSLHRAGPRGVMGLGRLTTQTSGSSLPGPLLLAPLSPRLFERERPYSVKLPLSLRRSSGAAPARRAAIAALTRSAHSLRFQICPGLRLPTYLLSSPVAWAPFPPPPGPPSPCPPTLPLPLACGPWGALLLPLPPLVPPMIPQIDLFSLVSEDFLNGSRFTARSIPTLSTYSASSSELPAQMEKSYGGRGRTCAQITQYA